MAKRGSTIRFSNKNHKNAPFLILLIYVIGLISIIKKKYPDTPVIAITGWGEYPGAFAIESQADKVLSKPFELSEIDKVIKELISSKKNNI